MTNIRFTRLITYIFILSFFAACAPLERSSIPSPWGQPKTSVPENLDPVRPDDQKTQMPTRKPMVNQFDGLPQVNVAILLPLSGAKSALGQSMLQSAQMAVFEMGYANFKLMPRDTSGTPAGAVAAANAAINDGAELILGPLFASSVRAIKPIAKAKNINIVAFSTDWTLADNSTFLMGFMPFTQVERVARYALSKGYDDYALIAPQDVYGNAVSGHFSEIVLKNGGEIEKSIRYNNGDDDLINKIATLKPQGSGASSFDAVFMPVGGNQTDMVASTLSYNGVMPSKVKRLGTGLWDDPRIADQPNMQGGWFAAPSPASRHAFIQKYKSSYGSQPVRLATLSYDATALAAILAKKGYRNGNQPAYNFTALTDANGFSGADGVFRFKHNGLVERQLSVLELRQGTVVEIDPAPVRF